MVWLKQRMVLCCFKDETSENEKGMAISIICIALAIIKHCVTKF